MIKDKTWLLVSLLAAMLLLGGCQLAVEDGVESPWEDRLIGALITTDYMYPIGVEQELVPEMLEHVEDGQLILDEYERKSHGIVYAIPSYEDKTYVFQDIKGFPMFMATMKMPNEEESYRTTVADDAMSDVQSHITAGDLEKIELEGTIYFTEKMNERPFYMNPVYQKENGVVYAVPGGPGFAIGGELGKGTEGSTHVTQDQSFTMNGTTKTIQSFIEVNFVYEYSPEKITVVEMDENNKVLIRREFEPGHLPDELVTNEEAEYLIIETLTTLDFGEVFVERKIINENEEMFDTLYELEGGILSKMNTMVNWR